MAQASRTLKPWNDEAMAARAAYNLGTQGHTGVEFWDPAQYPGIRRHSYYIFPFQLCVLAVWYKLAGFSLLSMRAISILWTLLMVAAIYSAVGMLTRDRSIALLAAILSAVCYHVMTGAAFGRYDTMVAALGFSAYAIYLKLRLRNLRLALLLSNACLVGAGTTHPNGALFFIGLCFLVFYFDRNRLDRNTVLLAAAPYIVGGIAFAAYALRDFPSFKAQLTMNAHRRIGLLHPWTALVREIQIRYLTAFGLGPHNPGHSGAFIRLKALSLAAYLIGLAGCLLTPSIRRNPHFRPLLVLTVIHCLYMAFYENMKFSYYLVFLLPLYCVTLAVFSITLWRSGKVPRWAIAGALAGVSLVQIAGIGAKIHLDDYDNSYLPAARFLLQHASAADEVAASCSLGFAYGFDRNLKDDPTLGYYNGEVPRFVVVEEIYDEWFHDAKTAFPDIYNHVTRTLASYDLIYDQAGYKIYRRKAS